MVPFQLNPLGAYESVVNRLFAVLTFAFVCLFWENTFLLSFLLAANFAMFYFLCLPGGAILVFAYGAIGGVVCEIIAIKLGVWEYTKPDIAGVPVWLPLVWGSAAVHLGRRPTSAS